MSRKPDFINLDNSVRFYVGNVSTDPHLGAYYQDCTSAITNFERRQFGDFDADGIPQADFDENAYYNVIYIIQYGLIHYDFYCKNNDESKLGPFLKCLDWIYDNKAEFKDSFTWPSPIINIKYNLPVGWVSAMYQGQAISLLLRGYQHTGDEKYLRCAEKAFQFFKYSITEGGAKVVDKNGYEWHEEYPHSPPLYVLNGFIYMLFGVLDFYRVTSSVEANRLVHSIYKTLINNIGRYDAGYWSYYDLEHRELVSVYYQRNIHSVQLQILYQLTGEKKYQRLADKWLKQCNPVNIFFVQVMYRVLPRLRKILPSV